MQNESTINEPLDLVRLALDERVFVKLKGERELRGKLHAYDSHCNLVLSDTDETIYRADNAEEGGGIKLEQKRSEMLFVRGDSVVLLSPENYVLSEGIESSGLTIYFHLRGMGDNALSSFAYYVDRQSHGNTVDKRDDAAETILEGLSLKEPAECSVSATFADSNALLRFLEDRLQEGRGEFVFELEDEDVTEYRRTHNDAGLSALLAILKDTAGMLNARVTALSQEEKGIAVLIRKQAKAAHDILEIRVAVVGNVDAGKSTMLGVLTKGGLDDGRGKARVNLFRHKHEIESGRTSSVGMEIMGFHADCSHILSRDTQRKLSWEEIQQKSSKIISFIDLAGHERYLKTTVFGLLGGSPDYCMLIIGANAGMIGMAKEHLGIALALNVPVLVVITKIDMCPSNVLQSTIAQLTKILKSPGCRKIPIFVNSTSEVISTASHFVSERVCPIFQVSNVSGQNIDLIKLFLNIIPYHGNFDAKGPVHFEISDTFSVPFVGTVVSGTLKSGVVHTGDLYWLGPDSLGGFAAVGVRSIQRKRSNVPFATAGQSATFALKRVRRKDVRKGMVLLSKTELPPKAVREFLAECLILYHQSTIKVRYSAMVHCGSVAQTCQIIEIINKPFIRTGDRALIRFRFLTRSEYINAGQKILFREGKTKGLGLVKEVYK